MKIKKMVQDIRKRGITPPSLDRFSLDSETISQANSGTIGGKPSGEAKYGFFHNGFRVLLGDNQRAYECLIGVGISANYWIKIKPWSIKPCTTVLNKADKQVRWDGVWNNINIYVEPSWNGIKTFYECLEGANLDKLKFTIKTPVPVTFELQPNGELAVLYNGVEKGYFPTPFGHDANGKFIPCSYVVLPDQQFNGNSYPVIQIVPDMSDGSYVYPLTIDPSFSYNYTTIYECRVQDATSWDFDRSGSGKSWSGSTFPKTPVFVGGTIDPVAVTIYDPSVDKASNPYMEFKRGAGYNRILNIVTNKITNIHMRDEFQTQATVPTEPSDGTQINWYENTGHINHNITGIIPNSPNGYKFNSNIAGRNITTGYTATSEVGGLLKCKTGYSRYVAKDSSNYRYIVTNYNSSTLNIIRENFEASNNGSDSAVTAYNDGRDYVVQATEATGSTVILCVLNGTTYLNLYKEATWTADGSLSSDLKITFPSGTTIWIAAKDGYCYVLINMGSGVYRIYRIDVDVVNSYTGSQTWATIASAGFGKTIGYTSDSSADYKILNPSSNDWSCLREVESEEKLLLSGFDGAQCLQTTSVPTLNGVLSTSLNTGIFDGFTKTSDIDRIGGATVDSKRFVAFYTPSTLYIYETTISTDTTPPTITAHNPANNDTGVAIDSSVYFELDDDSSGVDSSTINVTIEGVSAITNGVFQAGFSGTITADGSGLGYDVTINHTADWSYDQVINITVDCDDIDGNSMVQEVYSFTCVSAPSSGGAGNGFSSPDILARTKKKFLLPDIMIN